MLAGLAAVLVLGTVTVPAAVADEEDVTAVPSTPSTTAPPSTTTPTTPVESDEPPVSGADLAVEASVAGGPYLIGEEVPVTVTIANIGDADAQDVVGYVRGQGDFAFFLSSWDWDQVLPSDGRIAAGESVTLEMTGRIDDWSGAGDPRITVSVNAREDIDPANNRVENVPVSVVPPKPWQTVSGVVYGDADGDGRPDRGEELSGLTVRLWLAGGSFATTRTGADGRFAFEDVPRGVYELSIAQRDDWVGPSRTVRVDGSGDHVDMEFARSSPLSEALKASMSFDADTYRPGDTAHLTVKLTNSGDRPLSGVRAFCGGVGDERDLVGTHTREHFGDLAWKADGVTIDAGATKTYHVTGVVDEGAADYGHVLVGCSFGITELSGNPFANDRAKVVGKTSKTVAVLYHDEDGDNRFGEDEVVSGVTIGLRDEDADTPMLTAVTDDRGRADFGDIPAGVYRAEVFGKWRIDDRLSDGTTYEPRLMAHAGHVDYEHFFPIVPAPDMPVPDDAETPSSSAEPTSGPSDREQDVDELASTGVDAVTLGGVGLAVLLAGAVTLVVARRRRAEGSTES
ncbi:SdrD B-like domain-containing protein [Saccharomonospora azurea]|uniref:SdrD B-like domain-containing protein n=1 Tax=Saccharomonospora azurea TaxID=40988 RepID=UPI003D91F0F1